MPETPVTGRGVLGPGRGIAQESTVLFWKTEDPWGQGQCCPGQWPLLPEDAVPTPQAGPKEPKERVGRGQPTTLQGCPCPPPAHTLGFKGVPSLRELRLGREGGREAREGH